MSVRCKFVCTNIEEVLMNGSDALWTYRFRPVSSGSEENKSFWKWTPGGNLDFQCITKKDLFVIGKEYYLDLTLAE